MPEFDQELEDLKEEATELNITFSGNIGKAKLKEKIEAFHETQETSGPALAKAVEDNEKLSQTLAKPSTSSADSKRLEREKNARKTRVIMIIDNDQRQNNHTTTCTVNCSNQFFDLGTRHLPLGESIEVAQGHINSLKEVMITIHTAGKDGLAVPKARARYSISYEDASV